MASSNKNIECIQKRLVQSIKTNFPMPLALSTKIVSIDQKSNSFWVMIDSQKIECFTGLPINEMKENNIIRLRGHIKTHPIEMGRLIIHVDYFYLMSDEKIFKEKLLKYQELSKTLLTQKCQQFINNFNKRPVPKIIRNIGLIMTPTSQFNLDNIKLAFQNKCIGNLFIYHLSEASLEKDFVHALEYFKKYSQIDMICFISGIMNMDNIFELSSRDCIRYLINRKCFPYLVYITPNFNSACIGPEGTILELHPTSYRPLSELLANKRLSKIGDCFDFIHDIQAQLRQLIKENIQKGMDLLNNIVKRHKYKLCNLELMAAQFNIYQPPKNQVPTIDPVNKLKIALIMKLMDLKIYIQDTEIHFKNHLLDDERVQRVLKDLIRTEPKAKRSHQADDNRDTKDDIGDNIGDDIGDNMGDDIGDNMGDNMADKKEDYDKLEQIEMEIDDINQKIENKNANNNMPDKINVIIRR